MKIFNMETKTLFFLFMIYLMFLSSSFSIKSMSMKKVQNKNMNSVSTNTKKDLLDSIASFFSCGGRKKKKDKDPASKMKKKPEEVIEKPIQIIQKESLGKKIPSNNNETDNEPKYISMKPKDWNTPVTHANPNTQGLTEKKKLNYDDALNQLENNIVLSKEKKEEEIKKYENDIITLQKKIDAMSKNGSLYEIDQLKKQIQAIKEKQDIYNNESNELEMSIHLDYEKTQKKKTKQILSLIHI
jgi:hypothetical protein